MTATKKETRRTTPCWLLSHILILQWSLVQRSGVTYSDTLRDWNTVTFINCHSILSFYLYERQIVRDCISIRCHCNRWPLVYAWGYKKMGSDAWRGQKRKTLRTTPRRAVLVVMPHPDFHRKLCNRMRVQEARDQICLRHFMPLQISTPLPKAFEISLIAGVGFWSKIVKSQFLHQNLAQVPVVFMIISFSVMSTIGDEID